MSKLLAFAHSLKASTRGSLAPDRIGLAYKTRYNRLIKTRALGLTNANVCMWLYYQ